MWNNLEQVLKYFIFSRKFPHGLFSEDPLPSSIKTAILTSYELFLPINEFCIKEIIQYEGWDELGDCNGHLHTVDTMCNIDN